MTRPKKLIKPVDAKTVYHADGTKILAAKGEVLTLTPFWQRRKRDGAVTISDRPKPEPKARTTKTVTGDTP